jgi:hypothetical protein
MATELKAFSGSHFIGKPVLADIEFIPYLNIINSLSSSHGLKIFITSSTRPFGLPVNGAIVPPSRRSNHLVGHAIDMNIQIGSTLFTSRELRNFGRLPPPAQKFINAIRRDPDLRWGGDFSPTDPVHIDDGLNIRDPANWNTKFSIIQADLTGLTQPGVRAVGSPRFLFLTRPLIKGADVEAVQKKLIELEYDVGDDGADGIFGADTEKAVVKFQEDKDIDPVDGIVGDLTRRALGL